MHDHRPPTTGASQSEFGAGVQIDTGALGRIELGADYHLVREDRTRFLTWHLGILFRR